MARIIRISSTLLGFHLSARPLENGKLEQEIYAQTEEIQTPLSPLTTKRRLSRLTATYILLAIEEFKKGKVEYRVDKAGTVHLPFGKADFSEEYLIVNLLAIVKFVEVNKPSEAKGVYWKSAHICSSMGPSIRFNIRDTLDFKLPWNALEFTHFVKL